MSKAYRRRRKPDLMEIWIGLFLSVYLLWPGVEGFSGISLAKTLLFYLLTALLLILGIGYLIRDLRNHRLSPLTPAQIAALAFLGFTLLSAALSPVKKGNPWYDPDAHEAALTVTLYVLLFFAVSRWGRPTNTLFRILFWSLTAFCLLCLLQALGGNPLGLYPKGLNYYDGYGVRYKGGYAGTIGNVDIVSAFLALATPMVLLYSLRQKARKVWPCWALSAACVAVLIWIQVLCGLVGLALGAVFCLLTLCPDGKRKLLFWGLCGLGVCALALIWAVDLPVNLLHELHEILHGRFQDSFGTGRFFIWRQMLERLGQQLWTGVGPDMVRYSGLSPFIRYENGAEVARAALTDAHCYPLHILYCQGLPALLSWLSVVGFTLFHWVRYRRDRAVALLGGGMVCFLCAMLFCISSVIAMPFFWLTMGLIEARAAALRAEAKAR